jgi:beta-lactamase class A
VTLQERLATLADQAAGTFAFYVRALPAGERAAVHADEAFPAASVIKVPIMLRLLEMVQAGTAQLEQIVRLAAWHKTGGSGIFQFFHEGLEVSLEDACTAMITISDNTASNLLLDVTGIEPVNAMLDRYGCRRTRLHRYFGKPEMPGPAGPSQMVPEEMGLLFEKLARVEILTPALCELAMRMLRRQTHRDLIPRYLPEGTLVAHKTGSLVGVRHDAGIIWRAGQPVVFVGMSRDVADLRWSVDNQAHLVIARAAQVAWDYSSSSSSSSSSPVMASRRAK